MVRDTPDDPKLPDEPIERLALLIADLTDYAERGGMDPAKSETIYDTLMEGLAGLDLEGQATVLDRVRGMTEPPKRPRRG